jgi:5-oxoprolinase (ATP-hydrolysing) subunit C
MIEILSSTALCMIQDLGRDGYRRYGVGTAGVMDRVALPAGNAMLGNPDGAAGIEIQVFPFKARFLSDLAFSLTGADCQATLDGQPLPPWWTTVARAGQVLDLHVPIHATRAYLSIAGGFDVPVVLGSRSTQLRGEIGGFCGRPLRAGDCIPVLPSSAPHGAGVHFGVEPPELVLPGARHPSAPSEKATVVRVIPAAEHEAFDSQSRDTFYSACWKITPQSDRYGYRLSGPNLTMRERLELRSHGIIPGIIQVPPGGQPIIQLSDAQTAGGYPKIATIIEADLWRVGQAALGSQLRFVAVSHAAAVAAEDELARYIGKVRAAAKQERATMKVPS